MRPFRPTSAGLTYRCAESLDDVLAAWHLVYQACRRRDLIAANRQQIHTSQGAVGPQSLVLVGQIATVTASTLTATMESPFCLAALNAPGLRLSKVGRRVLELQLYADRRSGEERATDALLQLMALGWAWGERHRATDCVTTVEPTQVAYFRHAFGFEPVGERTPARGIRPAAPQVTMWCDIGKCLSLASPPIGLRFLLAQAPAAGAFDRRYDFEPGEVARSPIGDFLSEKYAPRAAG